MCMCNGCAILLNNIDYRAKKLVITLLCLMEMHVGAMYLPRMVR